jgi:hypothetical protein
MLLTINEEEDCFTGARYNILRVIAAYPLDADVNSQASKTIKEAIREDNHPLATLLHAPLLSSLTRCDSTPSVLSSLRKRIRDEIGDQHEVEQPSSKSRKMMATGSAKSGKGGTSSAKSGKGGTGGTKSGKGGTRRGKKNQ